MLGSERLPIIGYPLIVAMTRTGKIDIMKNKDEMHDKRKSGTGAENWEKFRKFQKE